MSVKIKLLLTCIIIFSNFIYAHKVTPTSVGSYLSGNKLPGSTITFTGASSHDNDSQNGGKQIYWQWDFDYDGSFNPSGWTYNSTQTHLYSSAGVKTIAVRYTDNDWQFGNIYTFQITIADEAKYYYAKDHLGSIRQTWDKNGNIVAAQDYYSYGEIIAGRSYNNGLAYERFKYTEKERDVESNYDYFGARYYDSELGMWLQADPLAEKYYGWSPYNYTLDNPLNLIDPDGKGPWDLGMPITVPTSWQELKIRTYAFLGIAAVTAAVYYAPAAISVAGGWWLRNPIRANTITTEIASLFSPAPTPGTLKLNESDIKNIVKTAGAEYNSQISVGARSIAKKIGHAEKQGYKSAFEGIKPTTENAQKLINDILKNPTKIVEGSKTTDIYNALSQGIRIDNETKKFMYFIEKTLESR